MAMLMAALAPSISQALAPAGHARSLWVTVCSATGTRQQLLDLAPANASDEQGSGVSADMAACAYCITHGACGLAPARLAVALLPAPHAAPVVVAGSSPVLPFSWTVAFSRGPPALA